MGQATASGARSGVYTDTGPFAIVPEWVLDADVSDRAVRLYAVLVRFADHDGRAFPSRRTLATRLRCSVKSIDRALDELQQASALEVHARRDDAGDRTTNLYLVRRLSPGGDMGVPTRGDTGGERGGDTGVPENESHREGEPVEREDALAAREYDPRKGVRIDGRDLPWDALVEVTQATEASESGKIARALKLIRGYTVDALTAHIEEPARAEMLLAEEIHRRAGLYRNRWPDIDLTPLALANNWHRVGRPIGRDIQDAYDTARRAIEDQRGGHAA